MPIYARGAKAAIVVFDLTNPVTLSTISEWLGFIKDFVELPQVIIVGNKSDLPPAVCPEAMAALRADFDNRYFQTSALTGDGIELLFLGIADLISSRSVAELALGATEIPIFPDSAPHARSSSCC
jgi:GTPase SAR1 family protein